MSMLAKAVHYREKAKRLRQKAFRMRPPAAVNEIGVVAALYDRLADKIEASNQNKKR
jgi:hypothetical protein